MNLFSKYVLCLVLIKGVIARALDETDKEWFSFKMKFDKDYKTEMEETYRYSVFRDNLKSIILHNMEADKGNYTYWLGLNQFADLTNNEFNNIYANLKVNISDIERNMYVQESETNVKYLPKEVDWRERNCVTHVKNQGDCGSCYAFAATGALEAQNCLTYHELVSLSEQNILDCTDNEEYKNDGCISGYTDASFKYATINGIDTEDTYPYRGAIGKCNQSRRTMGVKAKGYKDVRPYGNVRKLKEAVTDIGPVSVSIDARGEKNKFRFYRNGVYNNRECGHNRQNLNHALLLVGYGTTNDSQDYWIIKNSYGTCWGLEGYMLMARNGENTCGIATHASYPIV